MAVSGITLSLLASSGGGGIKMLQLRENLVTGLVGLVFLGSAAIGRPLIYRLAVAGVRRRAPEKVQAVEILHGDVQFLRSMTVATLVWGFGLLAACALNCTLVFMISIQHFLLMHGPINYATIGLMTAWTFWYAPRAMRLAAARLLGAQQGLEESTDVSSLYPRARFVDEYSLLEGYEDGLPEPIRRRLTPDLIRRAAKIVRVRFE
jgi:hypothetical protein